MPERKTIERARRDKSEGKAATTQAGEFVREEIEHVREGKHGARSAKQAIAIGLSKARRAGVDLPPKTSGAKKAAPAAKRSRGRSEASGAPVSRRRSRATLAALEREGSAAASSRALSKQAKSAARRRKPSERSAASRKAAQTKGRAGRVRAAKKAARTRANT
jgi:hypothetical protein